MRVVVFLVLGGLLLSSRARSQPLSAGKHEVTVSQARKILPDAPASCADIPCMLEATYAKDPKAKALALAIFADNGSVVGVGPDEIMDGGYRGKIHLVPELPQGKYRKHLEAVSFATKSIDEFFTKLFDKQAAPNYRWRGIQLRFVRSVGKRTPSAYAIGWLFAYNVEGSLMQTQLGARETYFHELFHSNDNDWSGKALRKDYDAIVKKCPGVTVKCLAPYAPNDTVVRGGTYYAFQQNNGDGVHEYAAELAVRYWEEHLEILAKGKLATRPFKCGAPENGRSWKALIDQFFGGRDLTPPC